MDKRLESPVLNSLKIENQSDQDSKIWRLIKAVQSQLILLRDNFFIYQALFWLTILQTV